MTTRISNINPVQYGIVYGVLCALLGLIGGVIVAIVSLVAGSSANMPGGMGLLSIVIFPIIYAIIGFIAGIVVGFIYNLVAGWTGGIELTLTTKVPTP
jgi:hypothetical protein